MMTLIALLLAGADARFEPAGLRYGDALLSGPLLELRSGVLVSGNVVEPLVAPIRVQIDGLHLVLEPGVRAAREADGLRLSVHAPARLRMSVDKESWDAGESVLLLRTAKGWAAGGKDVAGEIRAGVQAQQDDPEAKIREMQEAARRMKESSQRVRPPMMRRLFTGGNPFAGNEPAGSEAVRQLVELSLTGS